MTTKKEIVFPIESDGDWDEIDVNTMQLFNVVFTEDFGVFSKGEAVDVLYVNYDGGVLEAFNSTGEPIKVQNFVMKPV